MTPQHEPDPEIGRTMNEDLARKFLQQSEFTPMQADALAQLLGETATKDDLNALDAKIDNVEMRLRAEILRAAAELRSEFKQALAETRADLREAISDTRVELKDAIADAQMQTMRWGIAMIIAMSSIFTLLDIFID